MKHSDLIIMLQFSVSQPAHVSAIRSGQAAVSVQLATWSEIHGDTVIFESEHWSLQAPDIWLVTSKKK